jgi:hypothetical protein
MFSSIAEASVPALFPEDGSLGMKKWYFSPEVSELRNQQVQNIIDAFAQEGVEAVNFKFPYEYVQDIAMFDQRGKFVFQAPIIGDHRYTNSLTMGVANEEYGYVKILRVDEKHVKKQNLKTGRTLPLFLEGGGVITGRFDNGENYLIMRETRFLANLAWYKDTVNAKGSEQEAKQYFAKSLGIHPENLVVLPAKVGTKHLDLYIKSLPGGVLLIDDPSSALPTLEKLYRSTKSESILNRIEAQKKFQLGTAYAHLVAQMDLAYSSLKNKFKVIRVPGRFASLKVMKSYDGSYGGNYISHDTNYFNGVSAVKPDGSQFFIGNFSPNSPVLDEYWKDVLESVGIKRSQVHFPVRYAIGSGIDCLGAPTL